MKKIVVLLFVLLIALMACAPRVWYKPGATSSQRDLDLRACRYEAEARFAEQVPPLSGFRICVDVPWGTPQELELEVRDVAGEAVRRQYEDYHSDFVSSYIHDCMIRKGYLLVEEK